MWIWLLALLRSLCWFYRHFIPSLHPPGSDCLPCSGFPASSAASSSFAHPTLWYKGQFTCLPPPLDWGHQRTGAGPVSFNSTVWYRACTQHIFNVSKLFILIWFYFAFLKMNFKPGIYNHLNFWDLANLEDRKQRTTLASSGDFALMYMKFYNHFGYITLTSCSAPCNYLPLCPCWSLPIHLDWPSLLQDRPLEST